MRGGSDFVPVSYGVLAGLFGRRPQPFVYHMWAISPAALAPDGSARFTVDFLIANNGPGLARDLYVNLNALAPKSTGHV